MATILDRFGRKGKSKARQSASSALARFIGGILKIAAFTNAFGAARPVSRAASA